MHVNVVMIPNYLEIVDELRRTDFRHVGDQVYLDHAGSTVYPLSLVQQVTGVLSTNLFGNPHSFMSPSSSATETHIQRVRSLILKHFDKTSDEYQVVFTSNATDALYKIATNLTTKTPTQFKYLSHSHTSVVGMRQVFEKKGIKSSTITPECVPEFIEECQDSSHHNMTLFAYPAQCNATGVRFPLDWTSALQNKRHIVLLDASSYLSSTQLDLSLHAPDFVVFSFYKMFGYPTGLGCLLVKQSAIGLLINEHGYFGGGNVTSVKIDSDTSSRVLKSGLAQRLEHGTVNFHSIIALESCFKYVENIFGGWKRLSKHVLSLSSFLESRMAELTHHNGVHIVKLYSSSKVAQYERGPIINFELLHSDGESVSVVEVMKLCSVNGIHIRAGCFCNPGTCIQGVVENNEETICGFEKDGGTLRVSLGMSSTLEDVERFLFFLKRFFRNAARDIEHQVADIGSTSRWVEIKEICVFPVKSCAALKVFEWETGSYGLKHDRTYTFVDGNNSPLTQKRFPKMALIVPLEVSEGLLVLRINDYVFRIQDDKNKSNITKEIRLCGESLCSIAQVSGDYQAVSEYVSEFLGVKCSLVRGLDKGFYNESAYLLINRDSFSLVQKWINEKNKHFKLNIDCFRANLIVGSVDGSGEPFVEDNWKYFDLNSIVGFKCVDHCQRCQMVCVDPETGNRSPEPLSTLATHRRIKKKILFGVHLKITRGISGMIKIGDILIQK